jgi:hypothetical protein
MRKNQHWNWLVSNQRTVALPAFLDHSHLGYDAVESRRLAATFQRNLLYESSISTMKTETEIFAKLWKQHARVYRP